MDRIKKRWQTLTPDQKRLVSTGGILGILGLLLYLFISAGPDDGRRGLTDIAATDKNLLTGTDPKSLGIDSLGNDLRANEEAVNAIEGQLAQHMTESAREQQEFTRQMSGFGDQLNQLRRDITDQLGGFSRTQRDALADLRREVQILDDGSTVMPDVPKPGTLAPEEIVEQGLFDQPTVTPAVGTTSRSGSGGLPVIKVRVFGEEDVTPPAGIDDVDTVYLPAGAIVSGVLINGVDVPTGSRAKKDPMPILVRVKHDAILPNRYRSDVRECFIIVGTRGDLSTERAFMRGESLSCIRNDRRQIEVDIDAYAVGEDGKVGMRGRLVSRNGALVAKGAAAALAQTLSDIFRPVRVQSFNTRPSDEELFIAPDIGEALEASAYAGVGGAMGELADHIFDLADEILPFIEVDAGRRVDMILLEGAALKIRTEGA